MTFKDIFHLFRYITALEKKVDVINDRSLELLSGRIEQLEKKLDHLERAFEFQRGKLEYLDKYFSSVPHKNDIEEEAPEEIEVDESFRIPIVDGIKMKYEGQLDKEAVPVKLYGSGQIKS